MMLSMLGVLHCSQIHVFFLCSIWLFSVMLFIVGPSYPVLFKNMRNLLNPTTDWITSIVLEKF
jgi:hypothetical protein